MSLDALFKPFEFKKRWLADYSNAERRLARRDF